MGTVILLSSSPPRQFAPSPTPAVSSSPCFASPSSILNDGRRRFKNSAVQRDGFRGEFGTARSILGTKVGSENLPFSVTKRQQPFERAAKELPTEVKGVALSQEHAGNSRNKHSNGFATAEILVEDHEKKQSAVLATTKIPVEDCFESITQADVQPTSRASSPSLLDKAPSRRLDWTPPKTSAGSVVELELQGAQSRSSFPQGLLERFSYEGASAQSSFGSKNNEESAPTKRRRLDFVDNGLRKPSKPLAAPKLAPPSNVSTPATTKRSKSLKKKHTTITGLATSHYIGEDQEEIEARPMLQCLTATQARDIESPREPPTKIAKRKRTPKKPKTKKKSLPAPVLFSPESAMKAIDCQDMVFGSASQLARDDSPTFIRDVLKATKQSESFNSCTPVPTQTTILSQHGSATPRGIWGTSRFVKSRNLWATASRDEDNALLQVDTIDLFDSPDLRLAFTGKDALLEPAAAQHVKAASPEKTQPVFRGRLPGRAEASNSNSWLDIDEIGIPTPRTHVVSKSSAQTRAMHTTSEPMAKRARGPLQIDNHHRESAKRNAAVDEHGQQVNASTSVCAGNATEPPKLQMPAFSGFTTHELSDQIKKYGFKPFRKREKMIQVLESCWEAKHKLSAGGTNKMIAEDVPDEEVEPATHGDILSHVHGLAARPMPKVPKAKITKPKKDKPSTPGKPARRKSASENDEEVEKPTKQRKKAEPKSKKPGEAKEKVPGKRKAEASAVSAEYVIDISDIEDSTPEKSDKIPKPLAVSAAGGGHGTGVQSAPHLVTGPPTLPPKICSQSDSATPRPVEDLTTDLPDISEQITNAITKYVAPPSRDHQRDPTWYEKILMYDPIVLEDLAAWLNTEGLGLVGEDREVSALEVRAWCELKGVCCYAVGGGWRGNVKGKARPNGGELAD